MLSFLKFFGRALGHVILWMTLAVISFVIIVSILSIFGGEASLWKRFFWKSAEALVLSTREHRTKVVYVRYGQPTGRTGQDLDVFVSYTYQVATNKYVRENVKLEALHPLGVEYSKGNTNLSLETMDILYNPSKPESSVQAPRMNVREWCFFWFFTLLVPLGCVIFGAEKLHGLFRAWRRKQVKPAS